ncbi:MAG: hypothetical protein IH991_00570 [Planctomycetes bacterium]|nr:hypothetical protein [Planctomycetota bacterium]
MPNSRDRAKHWQFSVKELLLALTWACVTAAMLFQLYGTYLILAFIACCLVGLACSAWYVARKHAPLAVLICLAIFVVVYLIAILVLRVWVFVASTF